jgi:hypothetical protein
MVSLSSGDAVRRVPASVSSIKDAENAHFRSQARVRRAYTASSFTAALLASRRIASRGLGCVTNRLAQARVRLRYHEFLPRHGAEIRTGKGALISCRTRDRQGVSAEVPMRRVRYAVATSLDGYIAGPNGEADWIIMDPDGDFGEVFSEFDTVLIGRRTFEGMAISGNGLIPGMETFVFSRTLRQRDHPKVTVFAERPEETLVTVRAKPGKDI